MGIAAAAAEEEAVGVGHPRGRKHYETASRRQGLPQCAGTAAAVAVVGIWDHRRRHQQEGQREQETRTRSGAWPSTPRRPRSGDGTWARTRTARRRPRRSGARRASASLRLSGGPRRTRVPTTIRCMRTGPRRTSLGGAGWAGLRRRRRRRRGMRRRLRRAARTRSGGRGRLWRWRGGRGRVQTGWISIGARSRWR